MISIILQFQIPACQSFSFAPTLFFGRFLPMGEKKSFATRIDNDILKALKHLSVDTEKPINQLMEEAIMKLLKEYDKKPKK